MTLVEDVQELREQVSKLRAENEEMKARMIHVELASSSVNELRRAAFWVAGIIVVGAIGFGFSVLTFVPH